MTEIEFGGQRPVDAYGPGGFRIGGDWHDGSQIVTPRGRHRLAGGMDTPALGPLIEAADEVDVVVIGTGEDLDPLEPELRNAIERAGIGIELMNTPSACRTYNVLLAEARRVAAVLIAV